MTEETYKCLCRVLNDGLVTIKHEVRKLLGIKKGDLVEIQVRKIKSG